MGRPIPEIDPAALDVGVLHSVLQELVRSRYGTAAKIGSMETNHLKRGVYRYVLRLGGGAAPAAMTIIGKVYDDEPTGQRSFQTMEMLRQNDFPQTPPTHVRIPESYGYLPQLRLLLMQEAPGKPLKKLVKKQNANAEHLQNLAETLVKLHTFPLRIGPPFTLSDHLQVRCNGLPEKLAAAFPSVRREITWLLDRIEHFQRRRGTAGYTLAHGDFHLAQVHLHHGEYWLLDLDPLHHGDPAYDVAMVLFSLKQEAQKRGSGDYITPLRDAFLETYFAKMDWQIAGRLPLQEAMIHLKRACKRFYWQDEPGWAALIPQQIRQAVQCIKVMEAGPAPHDLAMVKEQSERCPVTA